MSYTELARTRPVPSAWENLSDEQNDAQTAAIYESARELCGLLSLERIG